MSFIPTTRLEFLIIEIIQDCLEEGKLRNETNLVYNIGREHQPSKDISEAELESESEACR